MNLLSHHPPFARFIHRPPLTERVVDPSGRPILVVGFRVPNPVFRLRTFFGSSVRAYPVQPLCGGPRGIELPNNYPYPKKPYQLLRQAVMSYICLFVFMIQLVTKSEIFRFMRFSERFRHSCVGFETNYYFFP